ncbi:ABC transporter ATP-binding protein [Salinarimonas sp. NSM]|uniref:ABC transporter ATP-binding protein n=1 Tax=Salinarimonas sp. NSM TaxID=3458003 RepID=UPI004037341F
MSDRSGPGFAPAAAPAAGGGAPALALVGVTRAFGGSRAVDAVDLEIREGEFFTIVGPSGSGKSTLLRMLAGLDRPSAGDILLRGRRVNDVPANARPTAMVFQSLALFDHMSVGDNIAFALKMRGVARPERMERARALLDVVHLPAAYLDKPVTQCSGGERQRVALARALASDPEILFFDEPLSAIDNRLRKLLQVEIKELHRRTGKTFVYITHALEEAMVMSDRVALMRAGRIVQVAPPLEIYDRPTSRFVAEFMGEVNVWRAVREAGAVTLPELGLVFPGETIPAPEGFLVARPEKLALLREGEAAQATIAGEIVDEFVLGSRKQIHLRPDGDASRPTVFGEIPADAAAPGPGARVRLALAFADCRFMTE